MRNHTNKHNIIIYTFRGVNCILRQFLNKNIRSRLQNTLQWNMNIKPYHYIYIYIYIGNKVWSKWPSVKQSNGLASTNQNSTGWYALLSVSFIMQMFPYLENVFHAVTWSTEWGGNMTNRHPYIIMQIHRFNCTLSLLTGIEKQVWKWRHKILGTC